MDQKEIRIILVRAPDDSPEEAPEFQAELRSLTKADNA